MKGKGTGRGKARAIPMFQTHKIHQAVHLNWFYYSKQSWAQWNKLQRCTKTGRTKRWEKQRPIEAPGSSHGRRAEWRNHQVWMLRQAHSASAEEWPPRLPLISYRIQTHHTTQHGQVQATRFLSPFLLSSQVLSVKVAVSLRSFLKVQFSHYTCNHSLAITTPFHT